MSRARWIWSLTYIDSPLKKVMSKKITIDVDVLSSSVEDIIMINLNDAPLVVTRNRSGIGN